MKRHMLNWIDVEQRLNDVIKHICEDDFQMSWPEFMLKLQIAMPDVFQAFESAFAGYYAQTSHLSAENQLTKRVIEQLIKCVMTDPGYSSCCGSQKLFYSIVHLIFNYFSEEDFTQVWPTMLEISQLFMCIDSKLKTLSLEPKYDDARRVLCDIKSVVCKRCEIKLKRLSNGI